MNDPAPPKMMLLVDVDACVRCYACEVACREEHGLEVETKSRWLRVMTVGPRRCGDRLHLDFVPTLCLHCREPLCREACPKEAVVKRDDGLVVIEAEQCTGCRLCVAACPFGGMSFNEVARAAGHCDQCRGRVAHGLRPACVQHCIAGALQWVTAGEAEQAAAKSHAFVTDRVCYVSATWRLGLILP